MPLNWKILQPWQVAGHSKWLTRWSVAGLLAAVLMLDGGGFTLATASFSIPHFWKHHSHHEVVRQAGWAGAGIAAGRAVGPAGSAAVGVTKYRHDLKAGGSRRTRALVKIGGPIAAGVVAGPAGSAGYEAVEHRNWIKRHIFHIRPHQSRPRVTTMASNRPHRAE